MQLSDDDLIMLCAGGMGTAYSLPRSPDDYLSNVDEMDLQEDCKCFDMLWHCAQSSLYVSGKFLSAALIR